MSNKFVHSLKFQITAVLFILLSLFSFAISYTLYAIDEREKEMVALHLLNRLQLITKYMDMQSLNYLKYAPKNNKAYKRDIDLYYDDLKSQLDNKNEIIRCFSDEHLTSEVMQIDNDINLSLNHSTKTALNQLQETWDQYYADLTQTLGARDKSPKLAAAAQYIVENQNGIKKIEDAVVEKLKQDLKKRIHWVDRVNKVILAMAFIIALITLLGFYLKIIRPLNQAIEGFNKVAKGDFGHQVVISTDSEMASIAKSFNHLSQRLHSIFQLIHRVQQGDDLDTTLGFIAEQFPSILPIDWTSVLLHNNGNTSFLELQKVYKDGVSHALPRTLFLVEGTLLEQAMGKDKPLLISNLRQMSEENKNYVFLKLLVKEGMNSAIFLHLTQASQSVANTHIPGLLIFASREENAYDDEHLELLSNIAHLVTHSFGKTIKMAEQKRLAAIGEFTSGIVHEVRNPLTTIGLALKYFSRLDLDEDGAEWSEISNREASRMARLLEDILLYSKPIQLDLTQVNIIAFVEELINSHKRLCEEAKLDINYHFSLSQPNNATTVPDVLLINIDSDRLKQILLNILRNAIEAANAQSVIRCTLSNNPEAHTVIITINNQGDIIPEEVLKRIGEPFFTTKNRGTGLGMGIVKRMVEAHSGKLTISSSPEKGTDVAITLPYLG